MTLTLDLMHVFYYLAVGLAFSAMTYHNSPEIEPNPWSATILVLTWPIFVILMIVGFFKGMDK